MNRLRPKLWMTALALFAVNALSAQDLTGTWQGTLSPGPKPLRIVIKISQDGNQLKATHYSIDQDAQPVPVSAITRDGATLKMTVAAIHAGYEGKVSADGNAIAGTWTQGGPLPLILVRTTKETEWPISEPAPPPKIMAADAKPEFEVATIKRSQTAKGFHFAVNQSGMLDTHNTSLMDLIKSSYSLHPKQITGGPSWIETDKYDIIGKPTVAGLTTVKQLMGMVQKLLADRFQLAFHKEKKEIPVYALNIAKLGIRIMENTSSPGKHPAFGGGGQQGLVVLNATMADFADYLQAFVLDRPVVDQTGLGAKRYDFVLKWTPDGPQGAADAAVTGSAPASPAADSLDAPPDIYAAFQRQLGLKLESTRAPVDVVVIDHVEKPSEN